MAVTFTFKDLAEFGKWLEDTGNAKCKESQKPLSQRLQRKEYLHGAGMELISLGQMLQQGRIVLELEGLLDSVVKIQTQWDKRTGTVSISEACWGPCPEFTEIMEATLSESAQDEIIAICSIVNLLHERIEKLLKGDSHPIPKGWDKIDGGPELGCVGCGGDGIHHTPGCDFAKEIPCTD